ncbi:MAG: hypothetical protein PHF74_07890 [Dehalococcoidales bacterium]|nr:hypothetical protein [Dehalococcoidales bacterium]
MSRFIDKLKQASLSEPPPLGFRTVQKSVKPRLLIIAQADKPDVVDTVDITVGADACLFNAEKAAEFKAVEKIVKTLNDIPCGCRISGNFNIDFEKTALDFVVFGDDVPAPSLLKSEKTGRIVVAEETMTGEMIRILDAMPQDAVFLDDKSGGKLSLTWQKLTVYKRFSALSAKPLLLSVPANLTADELQAIWDMGVNGLVVKVADTESFEAIKKLRQAVETLVPPSKNKHGKSRALVPQVRTEAPVIADDDGDGEEDE